MINLKFPLGPQSEWLSRRLAKDFDTSVATRSSILEIPQVKELAITADGEKLHATYLLMIHREKHLRVKAVLSEAMCRLTNGYVATFEQQRKGIETWLKKRDATLLPMCSSLYGAPMGRRDDALDFSEPNSVNLFEVKLDSGGYDNGGAYWGVGENPIFVARQGGAIQFVRARSRLDALIVLGIPWRCLKSPPIREYMELEKLNEAGHLSVSSRVTYNELSELRNS